MNRLETLLRQQHVLAEAILETEKRLPAHSVKPPVMLDLFALEDEFARVTSEIRKLQEGTA